MLKYLQLRKGYVRCCLSDPAEWEGTAPLDGGPFAETLAMFEPEILTFSSSHPMRLSAIFLRDIAATYASQDNGIHVGLLTITKTNDDKVLFEKLLPKSIEGLFAGTPENYIELPSPIQIVANEKYSIKIQPYNIWETRIGRRKSNVVMANNGVHLKIEGSNKYTLIDYLDFKEIRK